MNLKKIGLVKRNVSLNRESAMDDFLWWRDGVIYQIYPRSFADSNGDGFGDLRGITAKLDYLAFLRIDGIWFSPFFPSPDKDFGYDVADHTAIDPRYGTMEDFDTLVSGGAQARNPHHPRHGAQPHLRPAPVVRRVALQPREPQTGLVPVAGQAQQLGFDLRRLGLGVSTRRRGSITFTCSSRNSPT